MQELLFFYMIISRRVVNRT